MEVFDFARLRAPAVCFVGGRRATGKSTLAAKILRTLGQHRVCVVSPSEEYFPFYHQPGGRVALGVSANELGLLIAEMELRAPEGVVPTCLVLDDVPRSRELIAPLMHIARNGRHFGLSLVVASDDVRGWSVLARQADLVVDMDVRPARIVYRGVQFVCPPLPPRLPIGGGGLVDFARIAAEAVRLARLGGAREARERLRAFFGINHRLGTAGLPADVLEMVAAEVVRWAGFDALRACTDGAVPAAFAHEMFVGHSRPLPRRPGR